MNWQNENTQSNTNQETSEVRCLKGTISEETNSTGRYLLSRKITGWTSNLLASAIVVVLALAIGPQLTSMIVPRDRALEPGMNLAAWPSLQACSLQFGEASYQLARESFSGSETELLARLGQRCQTVLEQGANPVGEMRPQEAILIQRLANQLPMLQREGRWRVVAGMEINNVQVFPMVFGIRDGGDESPNDGRPAEEPSSRVVVWAMAMPGEDDQWTTYVATAAQIDAESAMSEFFPENSKRTLVIADRSGQSIVGFSGGEIEQAIAYYQDLALNRDWKLETNGRQSANSWSATISPDASTGIKSLHVQISLNHNKTLCGMLATQFKQPPSQTNRDIINSNGSYH